MNLIDQVIERKECTLNIVNHDTIKIMTTKLAFHKVVVDMLKRKNVEFHTYQPRQDRAYRVVLRNMHYSIDLEKLTEEIENHEHKVRNIWNIKHRVTGRPLSLFFLDLEHQKNNKGIYGITYLQNMRIQFEPPHQEGKGISQRKKCQEYFHTKAYCKHKPRWVKCGK